MKDWTVHTEPRADGSLAILEGSSETLRCIVYGADAPQVARNLIVDHRLAGLLRRAAESPEFTRQELLDRVTVLEQEYPEDAPLFRLFRGMVEDSFNG